MELHNIAIPQPLEIDAGNASIAYLIALDYFPEYILYGGQYTWGGYNSWLLKELERTSKVKAADIMKDAMYLAGGAEQFLALYREMPTFKPQVKEEQQK